MEYNFKTQYDKHPRVATNSGDPYKTLFVSEFDQFGNIQLKECGKQSIYDYIQSFKDSVDINILLKRFAAGDVAALNARQGAFLDITGMPKTYAEMLNFIHTGEQVFEALPVEERAKFDHSFAKWLFSLDVDSQISSEKIESNPVGNSSDVQNSVVQNSESST